MEAAGSGTSGSTEAGKAVTITSRILTTAFTDDAGTTFVTVTPTSKMMRLLLKIISRTKAMVLTLPGCATSNGQDKGGSIQVKLNSDITVDNVTVNNTVKAKTINATTIAGDTINATTVKWRYHQLREPSNLATLQIKQGGDRSPIIRKVEIPITLLRWKTVWTLPATTEKQSTRIWRINLTS